MANFAVIGVGGFVAPRHLRAIRDTGSRLVAATDPNDSVGVLDQYSFDVRYFRETFRFRVTFSEATTLRYARAMDASISPRRS